MTTLSRMEQPQTRDEKTWVKFTYFDERIRILTKIFRKSKHESSLQCK
jgi:hypothetical protein